MQYTQTFQQIHQELFHHNFFHQSTDKLRVIHQQ